MKNYKIPAIILFSALAEPKEKTNDEKTLEALTKISEQVDGFVEKLGDKADSEAIEGLKSTIEGLRKSIEGGEDIEGLEVKIAKINTENEKLHRAIAELEVSRLKEKEKTTPGSRKSVIEAEVEKFVKARFPENGEKTNTPISMTIDKADVIPEFSHDIFLDGADVTAFTGRRVETEINERKRKSNIIFDYFNVQSIDVPTLIYLRKVEIDDDSEGEDTWKPGGADWIACGTPKPKRAFRLTTGEAEAKKIAIFNTVDDCLVQDVPSMMNWIRNDFRAELLETANEGLLSGDGSNNAPEGLTENAVQYNGSNPFSGNVLNAGYIDAIIAAAAEMEENKETPAFAFVSSSVWYRILSEKDLNARYQNNNLIYTNALGQLFIAGVQIVKVDSEDVPNTHLLLVGADNGFKIFAYGNLVIETGLNGEDFRNDKTSIRGYQRFLTYIAEERENSVFYDTFATILSDIDSPEPVNE